MDTTPNERKGVCWIAVQLRDTVTNAKRVKNASNEGGAQANACWYGTKRAARTNCLTKGPGRANERTGRRGVRSGRWARGSRQRCSRWCRAAARGSVRAYATTQVKVLPLDDSSSTGAGSDGPHACAAWLSVAAPTDEPPMKEKRVENASMSSVGAVVGEGWSDGDVEWAEVREGGARVGVRGMLKDPSRPARSCMFSAFQSIVRGAGGDN